MLDERFVFVGFAIGIFGNLSYAYYVLRGKVKPNRVTWGLWTLAPLMAFFAQVNEGVGLQSVMALGVGLGPLVVFIASFLNKSSYWKLGRWDYVYGVLAMLGLGLWWVTGDGLVAILFAIVADGLAAIPTIKKAYREPETESSLAFGLCTLSALIIMLTVDEWTIEEFSFPVYILLVCILLFVLIRFRLGPTLTEKLD